MTARAVAFRCAATVETDPIEEYAAGNSGLQDVGDGTYQYNFKTLKAWARTRRTLGIDQ